MPALQLAAPCGTCLIRRRDEACLPSHVDARMRISELRKETTGTSARVVASVEYEDSERPPLDVFYEVPPAFADSLSPNPDAFLVGAVLPAARNGERRLAIAGDVCPRLREGITTVLHWMAHWYGARWQRLQLEVQSRRSPLETSPDRRTALFLSGGVDSLASLRLNRLKVPPEHPASIKDGILVKGFSGRDECNFAPALKSGEAVARDTGITLMPVTTNVRLLDNDSTFWIAQFHGAALASVAHTLVSRISLVHLASSYDIAHLVPWGSHPALDGNYGSHEVAIHHDGVHLSRLAKTALLAEWPVGLANVRVCTSRPVVGAANCGRCEKCVRTRLALLALGLDGASAFGPGELRAAAIQQIQIRSEYAEVSYADVIGPLERLGHKDHARAAQTAVDEYRRYKASAAGGGWKGVVKRVDRRVFGGALRQARSWAKQTMARGW